MKTNQLKKKKETEKWLWFIQTTTLFFHNCFFCASTVPLHVEIILPLSSYHRIETNGDGDEMSLRCGRFKVQKLGEEYFTFLTECQVRMVGWNTRTPFFTGGAVVCHVMGLVVLGVGCELKFDWDVLRIGCLFSCGKSFVLFFEIPW